MRDSAGRAERKRKRSEVSEERLRKADDVVWRALAGRVARYVAFAAGGISFFFGGSGD